MQLGLIKIMELTKTKAVGALATAIIALLVAAGIPITDNTCICDVWEPTVENYRECDHLSSTKYSCYPNEGSGGYTRCKNQTTGEKGDWHYLKDFIPDPYEEPDEPEPEPEPDNYPHSKFRCCHVNETCDPGLCPEGD